LLLIVFLAGNHLWTDLGISVWLGGWLWAWQRGPLLKRDGRTIYGLGIILTTLAYGALVMLPFYGNGIHVRPQWQIVGHYIKPERFIPYSWDGLCGGPLLAIATIWYLAGPLLIVVLLLPFI